LTQQDIDLGWVENQALVQAEDPQGNTLTDLSDDDADNQNGVDVEGDGEPDDVTHTDIPQLIDIQLEKEGVFNDENGDGLAQVGETISYTFTVYNEGNVTVNDLMITDLLAGVEVRGVPVVLLPGDNDDSTFTATYTLTESDIDAGFVSNTARIDGVTLIGVPVSDLSDDPSDSSNIDSEGDGDPDDPTVIETLGLIITDIITPNDDGLNDFWSLQGIQNFPHNNVKIYNRWGSLVYEQDHYTGDWDGYSNGNMVMNDGERLPVGTYYYVIDLGDGHEPFVGYLYLNR